MNSYQYFINITPFFFIAFFTLSGCSEKSPVNLPEDEMLKSEFYADNGNFNQLKNSVLSEGLYRVEVVGETVEVSPPKKIGEEQSQELFFLLQTLGVDLVTTVFEDGTYDKIEEVSFYSYRDGFVFGGQGKGYSFALKPIGLEGVVENLDEYRREHFESNTLTNGKRVYSKIEGSWYLFYEYFD